MEFSLIPTALSIMAADGRHYFIHTVTVTEGVCGEPATLIKRLNVIVILGL